MNWLPFVPLWLLGYIFLSLFAQGVLCEEAPPLTKALVWPLILTLKGYKILNKYFHSKHTGVYKQ